MTHWLNWMGFLRVLIFRHHSIFHCNAQSKGWAVNWMGVSEWLSSCEFVGLSLWWQGRFQWGLNSKQETPLRVVNFRFLPIRLFYGLSMPCHHHHRHHHPTPSQSVCLSGKLPFIPTRSLVFCQSTPLPFHIPSTPYKQTRQGSPIGKQYIGIHIMAC